MKIVKWTALLAGLFVLPGFAKCLDPTTILKIVEGYPQSPVQRFAPPENSSVAYCNQELFVTQLQTRLGKSVGYKVGFTGTATQQKFNVDGPAYGILLEGMFVPNGGMVHLNFGHRPMIEPDLMVIVSSDKIMQATDIYEVAEHLETLHAFIELPSLQFDKSVAFTGLDLISINIAATKMVMGEGMEILADNEFVDSIPLMQSEFVDEQGTIIQAAPLSKLMGHPFNVVLWLIEQFKEQGLVLQKGDRLSLGALGKLFPVTQSGKIYTYRISGPGKGLGKDTYLMASISVN